MKVILLSSILLSQTSCLFISSPIIDIVNEENIKNISSFKFSPDGKKLLFLKYNPNISGKEFNYVKYLDTNKTQDLNINGYSQLFWKDSNSLLINDYKNNQVLNYDLNSSNKSTVLSYEKNSKIDISNKDIYYQKEKTLRKFDTNNMQETSYLELINNIKIFETKSSNGSKNILISTYIDNNTKCEQIETDSSFKIKTSLTNLCLNYYIFNTNTKLLKNLFHKVESFSNFPIFSDNNKKLAYFNINKKNKFDLNVLDIDSNINKTKSFELEFNNLIWIDNNILIFDKHSNKCLLINSDNLEIIKELELDKNINQSFFIKTSNDKYVYGLENSIVIVDFKEKTNKKYIKVLLEDRIFNYLTYDENLKSIVIYYYSKDYNEIIVSKFNNEKEIIEDFIKFKV